MTDADVPPKVSFDEGHNGAPNSRQIALKNYAK